MSPEIEEQMAMVDRFAVRMKQELLANAHKGSFVTWSPTLYEVLAEVAHHTAKLNKAMLEVESGIESSRKEVDEFAADIANYMAKVSMKLGTMPEDALAVDG